MEGWIKLHRNILGSAVFDNAKLFKIWCWCLLKASHHEHDQLVGKQLVHLSPGQFVFGRNAAAEQLKMKPSTVWQHMKLLQSMGNIDIKSNNKFSVITIEKWGIYQCDDADFQQQNQQQMDNKWTTNEQQMNTNKNVKKDKNDNNDYSLSEKSESYPQGFHDDAWRAAQSEEVARILAEIETENQHA